MIMKALSYLRHIISKVRTKVTGRGVQFKSKGAGARGVDDIIFSPGMKVKEPSSQQLEVSEPEGGDLSSVTNSRSASLSGLEKQKLFLPVFFLFLLGSQHMVGAQLH